MNYRISFFIIFFICFVSKINAQLIPVSGVVYDISGRRPIESVIVYSNSNHAFTDSLGHYSINVKAKDSIWFSLFGKTTHKYPIDTIEDLRTWNP